MRVEGKEGVLHTPHSTEPLAPTTANCATTDRRARRAIKYRDSTYGADANPQSNRTTNYDEYTRSRVCFQVE